MRLLLFSDIHCDLAAVDRLIQRSTDVDVAVGAGDFANMHSGLKPTIDALSQIKCPTVLVPGNGETFAALKDSTENWANAHVLHGTGVTIDGTEFFGIGGGIPKTPFGSCSYDFSDDEATELLKNCPSNAVLVSHSPAKGLLDVSSAGKSLGSLAVLETVNRCEPQLVVCGHIHASSGRTLQHGKSKIVNAGPIGVVVEL
jgi:uncharacterized protein